MSVCCECRACLHLNMNHPTMWLLCLLGLALLNQGMSMPQKIDDQVHYDDTVQDGENVQDDEGDDYDDEDEYKGPPPAMISKGVTLVLEEGGVASLPCEVEGNPNVFSRIWRKNSLGLFTGSVRSTNDDRINQLPNGTLEIRQINASDIGTYSCMISAAGEPQEVAHSLLVKSPAMITKVEPSGKFHTLKKYSPLTLECIAQGYPTPSIKWFKNGHVLEDQDPSIHGAKYTIESASAADAGIYKCTASNGQQVPDERTIEIQVHYPPEVKIAREIVPTGVGYESELRCTVTGSKKPEVKWYKDNSQKPMTPSSKIELKRDGHDHILKIFKTQSSDFGDYSCEAKNSEGQTSAVIRLTGKPSRPILELSGSTDDESKNPLLVFKVESFAPIEEYELLFKEQEKEEWISVKPQVDSSPDGRIFTLKHEFTDLKPGVYVAQLKAKNSFGWSEFSTASPFAREHRDDQTNTGIAEGVTGAASDIKRISFGLIISLLAIVYLHC